MDRPIPQGERGNRAQIRAPAGLLLIWPRRPILGVSGNPERQASGAMDSASPSMVGAGRCLAPRKTGISFVTASHISLNVH